MPRVVVQSGAQQDLVVRHDLDGSWSVELTKTISLPLTTEQAGEIMFGEGYRLIKMANAPRQLNGHRNGEAKEVKLLPQATDLQLGRRSAAPSNAVVQFLRDRTEPATLGEIRAMLEDRFPGISNGRSSAYFSGTVQRLVNTGQAQRVGSRGDFHYRIGARGKDDAIENVTQSKEDGKEDRKAARRARYDAQLAKGLCVSRGCSRKHLKDKTICRLHLEVVKRANAGRLKQLKKGVK